MSTIAAPRTRLRSFSLTVPGVIVAMTVLMVASAWLRSRGIHGRFWIDEGISVGISSHPITDIPGLLHQDGSPPAYYLLLHVWMALIGRGEARTHALSFGFALLTIPTAFLLAREIFGRRAAWAAAVLAATNPYMTYYAQETRMYAMVVLLGTIVAGAFVLGFVERRRAWVVVFSTTLAALLYTHNWGFFLAAGTVAALGVAIWRAPERRLLVRDALLAYGGVAVLLAPWIPSLIFQAKNTGAPWSTAPPVRAMVLGLDTILGGPTTSIVIALVGGAGVIALWQANAGRVGQVGPIKGLKERTPASLAVLAVMVIAAVLAAWIVSLLSPAWANRYFAAFLGPLLLLAAAGFASFGRLGLVALAVVALFWLHPRTKELNNKSDVHRVSVLVRTHASRGDVLISTHPEQMPVLHYYLGDVGFRWASSMGWVRDPTIMDWRNAMDRLTDARPKTTLRRMLRTVRPGTTIVLIQPILRTSRWGAPWTKLVKKRTLQWGYAMDHNRRLARIGQEPRFKYLDKRLPKGVYAVYYRVRR